ncbi:MAG: GntR family transcriptional regulator, transcriptional repressor for pyruvate dehydrogenase complex [Solirubrobacteraceae bacterium]|jgi:GntR family transcriptional repressor for pyruvate dehydrogenase complex|nr:GntR family transcriptional regulator, transcriptional repressor for pyruvate dehydrogenase complex [Solirubrobacteraceae bacterium]
MQRDDARPDEHSPLAGESGTRGGEAYGRGLRAVGRRNLSEEVVDRLLEFVADGTAPERQLPVERILCERLDVSRNTVREALSTLTHLGVVETRGKGRYGSLVGARALLANRDRGHLAERELIQHPLEARRILEPSIAALAAERATDDDLAEIARALDRMEASVGDGSEVVLYDSAFHAAVARAAANPTLAFLINALTDALEESRELSFRPETGAKTAIEGHREILAALRAHDPVAANEAMLGHINDIERLIRLSLEDQPSTGTAAPDD